MKTKHYNNKWKHKTIKETTNAQEIELLSGTYDLGNDKICPYVNVACKLFHHNVQTTSSCFISCLH